MGYALYGNHNTGQIARGVFGLFIWGKEGKMKFLIKIGAVLSIYIIAPFVHAEPTYYSDRAVFLNSVGTSITDDYSDYPSGDAPAVLTNDEMSAVLGETRYQSISFDNLNIVGDVYVYGDGTNYCAGCNGNFQLFFNNTSLTVNDGVYGVGIDILLHTSRRSAIGDDITGDRVVDGTVLIEFNDGTVDSIIVPADIGFFNPEIFFTGITNAVGIKSITVGVDTKAHRWVIDNLTIGAQIQELTIYTILEFFAESVSKGKLIGVGQNAWLANLRLYLMREMLEAAKELIEHEKTDWACFTLNRAFLRCDGEDRPLDFVEGDAVLELNTMISDLMADLGCI